MSLHLVQVIALFLVILYCEATVYYYSPVNATNDAFYSVMGSMQPGDEMIFLNGTYYLGGRLGITFAGTVNSPIIIKGADGQTVIFNRPNADQNIVDFGGSNFVLQNIEFTGGSKGIRLANNVSNILLYNLTVHDTPETAVSCNDANSVCNNVTVRYVEVYNTGTDTGECFYFGCVNDGCIASNCLFENNYCHNTLLATAGSMGSGFQIKPGSFNNIVRNNVCWKTGGPCVLIYDDYNRGTNIVDGNLSIDSNDAGFQFTAGAILRNNIVVNSKSSGIFGSTDSVMPGSVPRNIQVLFNTVYNSTNDYCLRGNSWTDPSITVANNAFFCEGLAGAFMVQNSQTSQTWANNGYIGGSPPSGVSSSGVFLLNSISVELQDPVNNNFYPKPTSKLVSNPGGNSSFMTTYDYNCNLRSPTSVTVGAYQFQQPTNPGPPAVPGFKSCAYISTPVPTSSSSSLYYVPTVVLFAILVLIA